MRLTRRLFLSAILLALATSAPAACPPLVSAGSTHALLVRPDDNVWAWGDNISGQLGVVLAPGQTESNVPVEITQLRGRGVVAVSAGRIHSLALLADGTVYAWGGNGNGELGPRAQLHVTHARRADDAHAHPHRQPHPQGRATPLP